MHFPQADAGFSEQEICVGFKTPSFYIDVFLKLFFIEHFRALFDPFLIVILLKNSFFCRFQLRGTKHKIEPGSTTRYLVNQSTTVPPWLGRQMPILKPLYYDPN